MSCLTFVFVYKTICKIKNDLDLDVIAMIKKSSKINYEYNGELCNIKQIFSKNEKHNDDSKYLLTADVNIVLKENGEITSRLPARTICVKNRSNRKDWIAIITTDMSLSKEEIIRHYGNRWNIEVFFKISKQFLKLLKESSSTSFDAFIETVRQIFHPDEEQLSQLMDSFIGKLPNHIRNALLFNKKATICV